MQVMAYRGVPPRAVAAASGRWRRRPRSALVVAALVASIAPGTAAWAQDPSPSLSPGGSPGPSALPSPSPTVARDQARDETFELTIETDRTRVVADEPIAITTTLRSLDPSGPNTVGGSGSGLVAFGIEQLDGPFDIGPGWDDSCARYAFEPGEARDIPFAKSGGWEGDDPMATSWSRWFSDPELRLPAGLYRTTAFTDYGGPGCEPPWRSLTASLVIEVVAAPVTSPSASAEPSPGPSAIPSPSPTPTPRELWSPVDPALIPFGYTCGNHPPFTALDLTSPPGEEAAPGDIGDALRALDARGWLVPRTGWRLVAQDEERALLLNVLRERRGAGVPVEYLILEDEDGAWGYAGDGECWPRALFDAPRALAEPWELDPAYLPPTARSRVIHALVPARGCPSAVRLRGGPWVVTTRTAVIVAIPARRMSGDVCLFAPPTPVRIRLPGPLGDRTLYDASTLPLREVRAP